MSASSPQPTAKFTHAPKTQRARRGAACGASQIPSSRANFAAKRNEKEGHGERAGVHPGAIAPGNESASNGAFLVWGWRFGRVLTSPSLGASQKPGRKQFVKAPSIPFR